jgi:hypothetical protein
MNELTIDDVLKAYKRGWMTYDEAIANLLKIDPVRFQRQAHRAASFLTMN